MCGGGLCGTHSASPSWDYSLIFAALRARSSTPDRHLGRLRGARQGGAGYGATPRQFSYAKLRFAGLGRHRRRRRRAERHGYQSLTARQSRDRLLISGRVDNVNTPPPLHPPRSTPKESFQLPQDGEGTRLTLRELPSLAALAQVISLRDA